MPFSLSIYLDLVRFSAAMVVFLGHVSGQRLTGGFLWQINRFGSLGVVAFFVLSGWVISYVTATRETEWRTYTISRAARLYSVVVPAVLIGWVLDSAGSTLRPDLYHAGWGYYADNTLPRAIASLLFVNQLWMVNIVPGSNQPFWSMGFEAWYYLIFGLAVFAPQRWRVISVLLAAAIAGPRILILMSFWLMGVLGERACRTIRIPPMVALALAAGTVAASVTVDFVDRHVWSMSTPWLEFVWQTHFLYEALIATLFTLHLVGIHGAAGMLAPIFRPIARPVRWFAGATFTLYLFHMPLAQFLRSTSPWASEHAGTRALVFLGTFLASLAVAEFTERRKEVWRRWFTRLMTRGGSPLTARQ